MKKSLQHTATLVLLLMLSLIPAALRAEDTTQDNRRCVYVVGGYDGTNRNDETRVWESPAAIPENEEALKPYRLFETAPGSNIYTGYPSMSVPMGYLSFSYFRIYTQLNDPKSDGSHFRNNVIGVNESYDTEYTYNDDGLMKINTQLANNVDIAPFRSKDLFGAYPYLRLDLNENELLIDNGSVYYLVGDFNEDIAPTYANISEMRQWATRSYNMAALLDLPAGNHKIRLLRKLVGDGETVQTMGPASAYAGDWDAVVPQDRVVEWNADGIFLNEIGYDADNDVYDTRTIVSEGKSSWLLNNWPGGKLLFGENGNMRNLEAVKRVYLACDCIGWIEPSPENASIYADWALNETAPGSHVYTGRFNIPANPYGNNVYMRLHHALVNWNQLWSIGLYVSTGKEGLIAFDSAGHGEVPMEFDGSTAFFLPNWTGGDVTFTFDMNRMTLSLDTDPSHSTAYAAVMGDLNEAVTEQPLPGNEYAYNLLWESPKNSKRYSGTVYVPKGKFRLNFIPGFTADGLGAPTVCPVGGDVELEWDGKTGSCQVACETATAGVGISRNYWTSADWPGGNVTIKVDPKHNKVTFSSDVKRELGMYLFGADNEFKTPIEANREYYDNNWSLGLISPNVYEGDFFIEPFVPASDSWEHNGLQFRFMRALRGWGPDYSLGSNSSDFYAEPTPFVDGVARGTIIEHGLGNWLLEGYLGGTTLRFHVDLNDHTLTVTDLSSGLELNVVPAASIIPVAGGIRVSAPAAQQVAVYSVTGALVLQQAVGTGDTVIALPAGFYIVNGQKVAVR